jgi:hypothetical protein
LSGSLDGARRAIPQDRIGVAVRVRAPGERRVAAQHADIGASPDADFAALVQVVYDTFSDYAVAGVAYHF